MTSISSLEGLTRRDGVPVLEVVLADGETWSLALPRYRRRPIVIRESDDFGRPFVRIEVETKIGYRLEIRRLWQSIVATCCDGSAEEQLEAFRLLVVSLLLEAYDIDRSRAEALVDARLKDLGRIASVLIPTAFGQGE